MALDKPALKQGIVEILNDMMTRDSNSIEEFAERLSDKIDVYVRGAEIVYTSGLVAPPSGGPVTGEFVGNLQ